MSIKLCHVCKVQNIRLSTHRVLNKTLLLTTAVTTGTTITAVRSSIVIITSRGILQLQNSLILPSLFSSLEFVSVPNE